MMRVAWRYAFSIDTKLCDVHSYSSQTTSEAAMPTHIRSAITILGEVLAVASIFAIPFVVSYAALGFGG
jgi:hypothetical protein